jgi:hypothetical protein
MTSNQLIPSAWSDPSGTDRATARAEADRAQHEVERRRASRVIAAAANDAGEARELLAMLGLSVDDMVAARRERSVAA